MYCQKTDSTLLGLRREKLCGHRATSVRTAMGRVRLLDLFLSLSLYLAHRRVEYAKGGSASRSYFEKKTGRTIDVTDKRLT